MLALHTKLQEAGLLGKYLVISNSQGTLEGVKTEWIVALTGKKVIIVHDADRPGQIGANRWVHALAGKASEVRNVQLPYEVVESHGKDLRDYFKDGNTLGDWLDLVEKVTVVTGALPEQCSISQPPQIDLFTNLVPTNASGNGIANQSAPANSGVSQEVAS